MQIQRLEQAPAETIMTLRLPNRSIQKYAKQAKMR